MAELGAPSPSVKVVVSVRGDFLARVGMLASLGDLFTTGLFLLQPMRADDLRECIVGPAEASGGYFQSETIVDELLAAAEGGAALPLLQFTLRRLWEQRDKTTGEMGQRHLDALGGVAGSLAGHANTVYRALSTDGRRQAESVLTALVSSEGTRNRLVRGALPDTDDGVLEALVDGRLVVTREKEGEVSYELAHESLIESWGRLHGWLDAKAITRIAADRVREAATLWKSRGMRREELLRGDQLREAVAAAPNDIGVDGHALLAASRSAIRLRRLLVALSVAAVLAAITGAWMLSREGNRRALAAEVAERVAATDYVLDRAREKRAKLAELREQAYAAFDAGEATANEQWAAVLADAKQLRALYAAATPPWKLR